jgi:acetyl esterase/lipase
MRFGVSLLLGLSLVPAALLAQSAPPASPHEVIAQNLVYQLPGMDKVTVRTNLPYKKTETGELALDVYYPLDYREGTTRPAVVFINGVGDRQGSRLKDWNVYRQWGRLIAASGWIAVTFDARGPDVQARADIRDLFQYLRASGAKLGVDPKRLGAWVCSANVFPGLPYLMEESDSGVLCAVVYYGWADPARFRRDMPVFVARAGRDSPRLKEGLDRLFSRALAAGAPWTLVNLPDLHHAFDVVDETAESRRAVRQTLAFFAEYLSPPADAAPPPSAARRALAYWFGREYPEAASAYAAYVKTHPDDAEAWLRLGLSQAQVHEASDADVSLQKAYALGANRPVDLYNIACGYALTGNKDKALDWLGRAVDAGFQDRQLMTTDSDLESLRGDPRFDALVKRLP